MFNDISSLGTKTVSCSKNQSSYLSLKRRKRILHKIAKKGKKDTREKEGRERGKKRERKKARKRKEGRGGSRKRRPAS